MYPARHPNPIPPPPPPQSNPQHHAKEVISELCDRIKSEYTSMYAHIQNLKNELEKATNQRADYERFYSLNQDMSYVFNTEVHKMMDVIKRLVQACMQQVPFLPPDLQNSCVHLIEQVKHYTTGDPPIPYMPHPHAPIHGPPQPLPPPPHLSHPPHHNHINQGPGHPPPPPHVGAPPMFPPHMHSSPHLPPHHPMITYMSRMPAPHQPHHYTSESREICPHPPDAYRYPYREKEGNNNMQPDAENCNGSSHPKDKQIVPSSTPVNKTPCPNHVSQTGSLGKINGNDKTSEQPLSASKENVESDTIVEKTDENLNQENTKNDDVSSDSSSEKKSSPIPNTNNVTPAQRLPSDSAASVSKSRQASPPRQISNQVHPYERPTPPNVPASTRHCVHPSKTAPMSYPGPINKPCSNGSFTGGPPNFPPFGEPSHHYPMSVTNSYMRPPPPPPPPSHMPPGSYEAMMMPRSGMHMQSYGHVHPYSVNQMTPTTNYPVYTPPDLQDVSQTGSTVPKNLKSITYLNHGDVVCAVSFTDPFGYVFTGSKGTVKIWDVNEMSSPKLLSSIDCLKDNYVRACKSINENKLLIVSGEHSSVGVWSLTQNPSGLSVNTVCELNNPAPVCYDMAITPDEKQCYCCCSNGSIVGWDIEANRIVRNFTGHVDGATSIEITRDGNLIWTGGLDATVRCWDPREGKQAHTFTFPTQVFSLSVLPSSDYIVVGLENKTIELCYIKDAGMRFGERHVFKVHESCVLTVKSSNSGRWIISSSKDNYTNCVKIPQGVILFSTPESASILCTDISPEDKYVITGGGERRATIYECVYV